VYAATCRCATSRSPVASLCRVGHSSGRNGDFANNVGDSASFTRSTSTHNVDEQPIIDEIAAARADGIRTFIISSPGSEENVSTGDHARPWLSEAAERGGTALEGCSHEAPDFCHFDMIEEGDFGRGLRGALANIAGQIVRCEYALPAPPPDEQLDPERFNVVFTPGDGETLLVLRNSDADCDEGWTYAPDGDSVILCEQTCEQVQADPQARLELLFGCATEVLPVE
jgi:hypothetical protein